MAALTPAVPLVASAPVAKLRRHQWLSILGQAVRTPRGAVGLTLTTLIVLLAAIGPSVAPYNPDAFVGIPFAKPSGQFLLGTDYLGRDVLSRTLDGGWELLVMALLATVFGLIVGATAGISAAYLRGRADGLIMRTVDVILAFPQLVFALLLVSILGPKLWLIVLAVGFSHAPACARVLRSATLDVSERDFVKAVELQGMRSSTVMRKEILPNLISPIMVEAGLRLTYSIVIMAGLSYLTFGPPPPLPNWGTDIGLNQLGLAPAANLWSVVVPATLIALLTIGTNTFTDAIARVAIGVDRKPEEAALLDNIGVQAA
ncbi:MAG TPA: ABC transporter permease [Acidimicrobiales bacterium]|nr:ABC transporter permease [Acidimicrobiales bacterium]